MRKDSGRRGRLRAAPGERAHHRPRGEEARLLARPDDRQRRSLWQHLVRVDPARARRSGGGRPARAGAAGAYDRNGGGPHLGFGPDRMDTPHERSGSMTRIAFMFPGQGAFEAGMGRDIAEAMPEAMAVYDA